MQNVNLGDQKLRDIQAGPTVAPPLAVPLSGTASMFFQYTVPVNEMQQVVCSGGVVTVDDVRVTMTGAYLGIISSGSNISSYIQPVPGDTAAGFTNFGTVVPVQIMPIPGLLRTAFGVSLQGITLFGGDLCTLVLSFANSDAVAAHNVVSVGWVTRLLPFRLVSEQALVGLENQRVDAFLNQRLTQRR